MNGNMSFVEILKNKLLRLLKKQKTVDLNIYTMNKEFLLSTINDFENGGLESPEFLKKAHSIYNEYATFPNPLPNAETPYLLGIVFSYFAKYYKRNIDYYASILENALFCFIRVIKDTNVGRSEHQCAAIRMLLLIDDNEWAMKGIAHKFYEKNCQQLYGSPLMVQQMIAQGMEPWTFEIDLLKNLGSFCIKESSSGNHQSSISALDMERFSVIKRKGKYSTQWPLVRVPSKRVFELFAEFISEYVDTPYERRITPLYYDCND